MNSLVYGGTYLEKCISPSLDQIRGSGLRAAEVVSRLCPSIDHQYLTTLYEDTSVPVMGALAALGNVELHKDCNILEEDHAPRFSYLNPLAPPHLSFKVKSDRRLTAVCEAECAMIFGSLEASPRIKAKVAVYDPQNPRNPVHLWESGSTAERCALVLNHYEAMAISGERSLFDAARTLQRQLLAATDSLYEVIVLKMAHAGCWVCSRDSIEALPAYRTDKVFSIGSGDVFSSAFYAKWALEGLSAVKSAEFASRYTARFCCSGVVPSSEAEDETVTKHIKALPTVDPSAPVRKKRIYLAGPFFSQAEIAFIGFLRSLLATPWTEVFSPFHDVGYGGADVVYEKDIDALENSDVIFAVLTGMDPGTVFEVGYAAKAGKPIFCVAEAVLPSNLTMFEGCGAKIDTDLTSAIYSALWATLD